MNFGNCFDAMQKINTYLPWNKEGKILEVFISHPLIERAEWQPKCQHGPFYHIIAVNTDDRSNSEGIEQLGVFDPMPNEFNERLLALNLERFKHYVAEGAWVRSSTAMLLGTAGVLPLHPHSLTLAWRARQRQLEAEQKNSENEANKEEAIQ
ncbi:probable 28S ribosomal protein S16, mitochondrial [Nephila pilipes]|uniref:Small ribosomal subunit protein bS16m n=1 Tax=Nephila pilipes TaxID=299642 RepID=A0A8X6Q4A0_NEPPI|nr:probable 28S ribosomal protein S16, mitochondrial [Nephila pilipes]